VKNNLIITYFVEKGAIFLDVKEKGCT